MKTYKARGVVLHTVKYGDSALIAYILTDTLGRQTYMVQGGRSAKSRSNKAALLQPMFLVEVEGIVPTQGEMHRIREIRTSTPLVSIPFDARKSTIALFMAEVLYRLIKEVEAPGPLFDFIAGSVAALDRLEEGTANFHLWFLVQMSYFLGFYPGNEYREGWWFDVREGLFVQGRPSHAMILSQEASRTLDALMAASIAELGALELSRTQRSGFLAALLTYFGYHLDGINRVESLAILRDVF